MLRSATRSRIHTTRFESLEERLVLSAAPPTVVDVAVASSQWNQAFLQDLADNQLGDGAGYSVPTGIYQDDSIPWLNMDRIRITFSEDVYIDAADLSVSGVINASYEITGFEYDPETDVAEWTLATPIGNDRIMLDLDSGGADPVRDLSGDTLDGEWTDGVSTGPSGNGTAGGDFEFSMQFLPGDAVNYGTQVEMTSVWACYLSVGQDTTSPNYVAQRDLDGDGIIENSDWQYVYANLYDAPPAGTPAAATSDAPTTSHFDLQDIDNDAVDVAISLWDVFDDEEDSDSQLTYSIKSVSDPSLLDYYYIDATTGSLIVNGFTPSGGGQVSGRTEITVSVEDTSGQTTESTVPIDLHRNNYAPTVTASPTQAGGTSWTISGWVGDGDDDLEDLYVTLSGAFSALVSVAADGYYSYTGSMPVGSGYSEVLVSTADPHGEVAQPLYVYIGW